LDWVGKNKKVLDIGCATGQVARRLKGNGCEVIGIESDVGAAQIAKEYCEAVLIANLEDMEDLPYHDYFDYILLLDVLEHLQSPLSVLERMKAHLKRNGSIIVSLPNIANWTIRWDLLFGRFRYSDYGILDRTHLRFFDETSARKLISDAGFEIVRFDIVPTLPIIHVRIGITHHIAKIRPNLFAMQFIIEGKPKRD
jgi:2-polyprenyl-3-methyl-5-hydroxy-6-metoxy-1,4-benzoquinol methylase